MSKKRTGKDYYLCMIVFITTLLAATSLVSASSVNDICQSVEETQVLGANEVADALGPLTGVLRFLALRCLEPKVVTDLSGTDFVRIVGDGTSYRQNMLCTIKEHARDGLIGSEVADALGPLTGVLRSLALRCLEPKIANGLAGADFVQIVGDGTSYRQNMLCTIKEHASDGLSASEVADALGPLTGVLRSLALRCLEPKIANGLAGTDFVEIVGDGTSYRQNMLCTMKEHASDGLSASEVTDALGLLTGVLRSLAVRCLESKSANGLAEAPMLSGEVSADDTDSVNSKVLPLTTLWGQDDLFVNTDQPPCDQNPEQELRDGLTALKPGCPAVVVGQLINYYLENGYADGWLDIMLQDVKVYPQPWAGVWGETCIHSGHPTENSYSSANEQQIKTLLWHVGIGLDTEYKEDISGIEAPLYKRLDELICPPQICGTAQDLEQLASLLESRFRFGVNVRPPRLVGRLNEFAWIIRASIDAEHPIILQLQQDKTGLQAKHMALIFGYRNAPSGDPDDFEFLVNYGWGPGYPAQWVSGANLLKTDNYVWNYLSVMDVSPVD